VRLVGEEREERGQSSVEFALVALAFFAMLLVVIQLALIAVAKHELNHLAFQTARLWSVSKADKIDTAVKQATTVYKKARQGDRLAAYFADNLSAKVDGGAKRVTFTGYIPLVIPGAAHIIQNKANAGGRGSPTGRDVKVTLIVPMAREPAVNQIGAKRGVTLKHCDLKALAGKKSKSKKKPPPCYDNDNI